MTFNREKALLDKLRLAVRVPASEHKDPVIWDGDTSIDVPSDGEVGQGYFRTVERMRRGAKEANVTLPSWGWATEALYLSLDARDVVRAELESGEYPEDSFDQIPDANIETLQGLIDGWSKDLPSVGWIQDETRVVVLDDVAFNELLADTGTEST
jgi:hypothetical protein